MSACSAFALEAARLLKARGAVSPAPAGKAQAEVEEGPEDGELPAAPAAVQEQGGKKRKHSPIVWQEGGKRAGRFHVLHSTLFCSTASTVCCSLLHLSVLVLLVLVPGKISTKLRLHDGVHPCTRMNVASPVLLHKSTVMIAESGCNLLMSANKSL